MPTTTVLVAAEETGVSGPIEDPLAGVSLVATAWSEQDLETLASVSTDGLTVAAGSFSAALEPFTAFHWANNTEWDVGECSVADNLLTGDYRVTCVLGVTDDFFRAGGVSFADGSVGFVLDDGYITSLSFNYHGPAEAELFDSYVGGFLGWLEANHPDEFRKTINPAIGQIFTAEAALVYVDYVDEWLAAAG